MPAATREAPAAVFATGAAATAAMMVAARLSGSLVMRDMQQLAGTVVLPPSRLANAVGTTIQLANGGLFAHLYDLGFTTSGITPNWRRGAAGGVLHAGLGGLLLAVVPPLHPRVPEELPAPGAFHHHRGAGAAALFVALHVMFGALVGGALGSIHARARRTRRDH